MTQQIDIFDESLFVNGLTPRQWKLHNLLLNVGDHRLSRKEILEKMDADYGYSAEMRENPHRHFMNLSSLRQMTDDLDAVERDQTIQHVYIGGRYADNEKDAWDYLDREEISALKKLQKVWDGRRKLAKDGQQRLVFAQERDHWESLIKQKTPAAVGK